MKQLASLGAHTSLPFFLAGFLVALGFADASTGVTSMGASGALDDTVVVFVVVVVMLSAMAITGEPG